LINFPLSIYLYVILFLLSVNGIYCVVENITYTRYVLRSFLDISIMCQKILDPGYIFKEFQQIWSNINSFCYAELTVKLLFCKCQ